jgi:hypothetical protein
MLTLPMGKYSEMQDVFVMYFIELSSGNALTRRESLCPPERHVRDFWRIPCKNRFRTVVRMIAAYRSTLDIVYNALML